MAKIGGGACIVGIFFVDDFDDVMNETQERISILQSHFIDNTGIVGGGLMVITEYFPSSSELFQLNALISTAHVSELFQLNAFVGTVHIQSTTFTGNSAWAGSAVFVTQPKPSSLAAGGQTATIHT